MTMTKSRVSLTVLSLAAAAVLFVAPQRAFAKDDFGRIVHHIEANYHTHRHYRFVMGLAGFTFKVSHFAGVKSFKGAIFENSQFANSGSDVRFDQVIRAAMDSGWQPMVQSYDRHSGERTYIYAQDLGKDMRLLVVNFEPTEAVVIQVKVNTDKLSDFVKEASGNHGRHNQAAPAERMQPAQDETVELAANTASSWDGICLSLQESEQRVNEQPINNE
ncbi:MAG TPA: hypothetical protein VGK22_17435 [Candidatus Angelobacter sp.]|jgi:hypothetical protein